MKKSVQLITNIRSLYHKMTWLNEFEMKDRFGDYTSSEVHCIEFIGKNEEINVTKLAEAFYMTRGAISKMSKKLIKKGAIEFYKKPDNKKEIYFRLTDQGNEVYKLHEKLHDEFLDRDKAVYDQVSEEQFDAMLCFIENFSDHLDLEIEKRELDIK